MDCVVELPQGQYGVCGGGGGCLVIGVVYGQVLASAPDISLDPNQYEIMLFDPLPQPGFWGALFWR